MITSHYFHINFIDTMTDDCQCNRCIGNLSTYHLIEVVTANLYHNKNITSYPILCDYRLNQLQTILINFYIILTKNCVCQTDCDCFESNFQLYSDIYSKFIMDVFASVYLVLPELVSVWFDNKYKSFLVDVYYVNNSLRTAMIKTYHMANK